MRGARPFEEEEEEEEDDDEEKEGAVSVVSMGMSLHPAPRHGRCRTGLAYAAAAFHVASACAT